MADDDLTLDLSGPRNPEQGQPWSPATMSKAERLLHRADRITFDASGPRWWVQGNAPEPYVVRRMGAWLTCSCPNGEVLGGHSTCYHTAAVHLIYEDGLTKGFDGRWR